MARAVDESFERRAAAAMAASIAASIPASSPALCAGSEYVSIQVDDLALVANEEARLQAGPLAAQRLLQGEDSGAGFVGASRRTRYQTKSSRAAIAAAQAGAVTSSGTG